jgi:hypothetical protein
MFVLKWHFVVDCFIAKYSSFCNDSVVINSLEFSQIKTGTVIPCLGGKCCKTNMYHPHIPKGGWIVHFPENWHCFILADPDHDYFNEILPNCGEINCFSIFPVFVLPFGVWKNASYYIINVGRMTPIGRTTTTCTRRKL